MATGNQKAVRAFEKFEESIQNYIREVLKTVSSEAVKRLEGILKDLVSKQLDTLQEIYKAIENILKKFLAVEYVEAETLMAVGEYSKLAAAREKARIEAMVKDSMQSAQTSTAENNKNTGNAKNDKNPEDTFLPDGLLLSSTMYHDESQQISEFKRKIETIKNSPDDVQKLSQLYNIYINDINNNTTKIINELAQLIQTRKAKDVVEVMIECLKFRTERDKLTQAFQTAFDEISPSKND